MAYPEVPWIVKGENLLLAASYLMPVKYIEALVPRQFKIVRVLPNTTLGVVTFNKFGEGSELEYFEIYCSPALVSYKDRTGFYIKQMFVDNKKAFIGVNEASGIEKEMADFHWDKDRKEISVDQKDHNICKINYKALGTPLLKTTLHPKGMGMNPEAIINYKGIFRGKLGFAKFRIESADNSNMKLFVNKKPILSVCLDKWDAELLHILNREEYKSSEQ
ncbi:acetoacetate decarboxylase family protein [bacterium]|nr:acetoacetate decarboxylase family protein [bacterium]